MQEVAMSIFLMVANKDFPSPGDLKEEQHGRRDITAPRRRKASHSVWQLDKPTPVLKASAF